MSNQGPYLNPQLIEIGWTIAEAKFLYEITLGKMLQPEPRDPSDRLVPYLRAANVQWDQVSLDDMASMYASYREVMGCRVSEGDLLVCEGGEVGRCSIIRGQLPIGPTANGAIIQNSLHRVRGRNGNSVRFLSYFLRHVANSGWFDVLCNRATIAHFTVDKFHDLPVVYPQKNKQEIIADFLDRETTRIDALIAKKTRFIELLREKRQALITRAVTKGLDPNVKMKDSGVEWLGEVPEHWIVSAFKRIVSSPITDGPHETPEFLDTGIPFVSAEAVSSGSIDFNKIRGYISHEDHAQYSKKYRPELGDIFMVKSGATTGVTAIVETDIDFNIWSPLAVIRCGSNASPRFVLNFMRSKNFQEAIATNWSFGTQQNIGMGVIEDLAVLVPPLDEQKAIATLLSVRTARIDMLTAQTKQGMSLLHERRSALITAAVTGLIDVRHFSNESINNLASAGAAS
ncbi:MAG: restriction endonuclease subunit S [Acidithiobacillus sp.]|nr:restriction endonuclease subunit S [Acidithiobacillus sp.]